MPHDRARLVAPTILKKLRFFPIVALQGARQTGKSFLARQILPRELRKIHYLTLDDESLRSAASVSARSFLIGYPHAHPLVIDEAQKCPALFDALKLLVDRVRNPGRFILLGSTEFSRLSLIREALTGRMGRVRVFPLTLSECFGKSSQKASPYSPTHLDLLNYLERGGLPGVCFIREKEHRDSLFRDWLDLTCRRDIYQFKKTKLDGDLAWQILRQCALLEEPTRANISSALRQNPKRIQSHLGALTELFVIQKLLPHPSGTGKPLYLPFDSGIATFLGAHRVRSLHIWLMNELLVRDQNLHSCRSELYYYRSTGKKIIHLVESQPGKSLVGYQLIDHDHLKLPDAELMKAFCIKNPQAKGVVCAPIDSSLMLSQIPFIPWETACRITPQKTRPTRAQA